VEKKMRLNKNEIQRMIASVESVDAGLAARIKAKLSTNNPMLADFLSFVGQHKRDDSVTFTEDDIDVLEHYIQEAKRRNLSIVVKNALKMFKKAALDQAMVPMDELKKTARAFDPEEIEEIVSDWEMQSGKKFDRDLLNYV